MLKVDYNGKRQEIKYFNDQLISKDGPLTHLRVLTKEISFI